MNVKKLSERLALLISHLMSHKYSDCYIGKYKFVSKLIVENLMEHSKLDDNFFERIYHLLEQRSVSKSTLYEHQCILRGIRSYIVLGEYPNRGRKSRFLKEERYKFLSPEFQSIIDYYVNHSQGRKKETAIYRERMMGIMFLTHLQSEGCMTISDVSEASVLSFFYSGGEIVREATYKGHILAVLKINQNRDEIFRRLISFLPNPPRRRKNIQYLTDEEMSRIKEALSEKDNDLTLRDKAIGTIAMYTGLRSCDIAALGIENIDWNNDLIILSQQKTGNSLRLPLMPTVGNAIFEYILKERPPETTIKTIFVHKKWPYSGLTRQSMYSISDKIMEAADIRRNTGDRKGFHLFRHHLATKMLGNDVPRPVVSATLGHSSPESLSIYLNADFIHLKEFALSIEEYPMDEKLFTL